MLSMVVQSAKGQLFISDQNAAHYAIYDKWQSLNLVDNVIEFKMDGSYIAYSKGVPQIELQYKVVAREHGLIEIDILSGEDDPEPGKVTIQVINPERIRIYVWKHGDVLDVADEYHRTDDFDSMNAFLRKIIKQ